SQAPPQPGAYGRDDERARQRARGKARHQQAKAAGVGAQAVLRHERQQRPDGRQGEVDQRKRAQHEEQHALSRPEVGQPVAQFAEEIAPRRGTGFGAKGGRATSSSVAAATAQVKAETATAAPAPSQATSAPPTAGAIRFAPASAIWNSELARLRACSGTSCAMEACRAGRWNVRHVADTAATASRTARVISPRIMLHATTPQPMARTTSAIIIRVRRL